MDFGKLHEALERHELRNGRRICGNLKEVRQGEVAQTATAHRTGVGILVATIGAAGTFVAMSRDRYAASCFFRSRKVVEARRHHEHKHDRHLNEREDLPAQAA